MTPRQHLFCREYTVDLNATQAAVRAGYSANTANREGTRLLANPEVKAEVDRLLAERAGKVDLTAEWVLNRLRAEAEFTGEGSSHSARVRALELLGKRFGLFEERHRHEHLVELEVDDLDVRTLSDEELARLLGETRAELADGEVDQVESEVGK